MALAAGDVVAERYRIVRELGRGGSGVTYEAENLRDGGRVALKHVALREVHEWKSVELFEREAQTLAHLHHPAIPRYVDHFADESRGAFVLVQELAPGRSLAEWRDAGWHPDETELKHIADEVLQVLRYLQSLNPPVVHRDIKPHNLIRDESGTIRLVDFGAVRTVTSSSLTAGSTIVGTYGYMAPEQLHGSARPASDLYGLGTTLLFLMTGRPPNDLPHRELRIDFQRHVTASRPFAAWLARMVEPAPEHRFASAHLALAALRDESAGARAPRSRGERRRLIALASVLGVLAVASVPIVRALRVVPPAPGPAAAARLANGLPPRPALPRYSDVTYGFAFPAHFSAIFSVGFTADGTRILTGSNDHTLKLWNATDGKPARAFPGHTDRVGGIAISTDGVHAFSGGDTTVKLWNLTTGAVERNMSSDSRAEVTTIALSPDESRLAVARLDGTAEIWNPKTGERLRTLAHSPGKGRVITTTFAPTGQTVATAGDDAVVRLWNAEDGTLKQQLRGHQKTINAVVFAPDGQTMASASDDHSLKIWHADTARLLTTLSLHTDEVWAAAFSPDGSMLVSGGKDRTIGIWSVLKGTLLDRYDVDSHGTLDIAFSPDGRTIATGHGDGNVRIWRAAAAQHAKVPAFDAASAVERTAPANASEEERLTFEARNVIDRWSGGHELVDAKKLLEQALAKRPGYAPALSGLARVAFKQAYRRDGDYDLGGLEQALGLADRAVAADAKLAEAHATRAWIFDAKKDFARARASADEAERLDAGSPAVAFVEAQIDVDTGDFAAAEKRATKVITTSKDRASVARAYSVLLDVYRKQNDYVAMDEVYRRKMALEPASAWAKGNYGSFLVARGEYEKAIDVVQAALAQMNYGVAHRTLAEAYAGHGVELLWDHGDAQGAKVAFDRGVLADPTYAVPHYGLGAYYVRTGAAGEAKKAFARALELDPESARTRAALATLE